MIGTYTKTTAFLRCFSYVVKLGRSWK